MNIFLSFIVKFFLFERQNIVFRSHTDEKVSEMVNDDAYETKSENLWG